MGHAGFRGTPAGHSVHSHTDHKCRLALDAGADAVYARNSQPEASWYLRVGVCAQCALHHTMPNQSYLYTIYTLTENHV